MKLLTFTQEDHDRKSEKAKRARQVLAQVSKGGKDNVINITHITEVKLWENNKPAWLRLFDGKTK